jgi:hypothetical protein
VISKSDLHEVIEEIFLRRLGQFAEMLKTDLAELVRRRGVGEDVGGPAANLGPRYLLRKGWASWKLVFAGKAGEIKDEKGLAYIAYLLVTAPGDAIHGAKLAAQVFGYAQISEASLGTDDGSTQRAIEEEAKRLASVIQSESASDMAKADAREKLEELAEVRKAATKRPETNVEKTVRAVRKSIQRAHSNLVTQGRFEPAVKNFAEHIENHLLAPSARYTGRRGTRVKAGVAGTFIYEAPPGVVWAG